MGSKKNGHYRQTEQLRARIASGLAKLHPHPRKKHPHKQGIIGSTPNINNSLKLRTITDVAPDF